MNECDISLSNQIILTYKVKVISPSFLRCVTKKAKKRM